jgi:hypothetical protein
MFRWPSAGYLGAEAEPIVQAFEIPLAESTGGIDAMA